MVVDLLVSGAIFLYRWMVNGFTFSSRWLLFVQW